MFFKEALEKLEVEPQIIRHGKFKSARPGHDKRYAIDARQKITHRRGGSCRHHQDHLD
ncbi:hypothetical protein N9Y26_00425 [bacterium]|nr:hypothetical protein [bacterium]